MPQYLFTYGTLRPGHAPPEIASAVAALILIGTATISARLYDLGDYPGVILDEAGDLAVTGTLYELPADPTILAALDRYEDFRPADPAASLFLRQQATATLLDSSTLQSWVYTWNGPAPLAE